MRSSLTEKGLREIRAQGAAAGLFTVLLLAVTAAAYLHIGAEQGTLTLPDLLLPALVQEYVSHGSEALLEAEQAVSNGDYAAADSAYRRARAQIPPDDPASAAQIDRRRAELLRLAGKPGDAEALLRQAIGSLEEAEGADGTSAGLAAGLLALWQVLGGEQESGLAALKKALSDIAAGADSPADRIEAISMLAQGFATAGQSADAVRYYSQLCDAAQETENLAEYQSQYAHALVQDRQYAEAEAVCRAALAQSPEESVCIALNRTLARACAGQQHSGDMQTALAALESALPQTEYLLLKAETAMQCGDVKTALAAAYSAEQAAEAPALAEIIYFRGQIMEAAGNHIAARELYQRARALYQTVPAAVNHALCRVCTALRQYEDAIGYGESALEASEPGTRQTIPILADLALACLCNYDIGRAMQYAEQAVSVADAQTLPRPESAAAPLAMGRILTLTHKPGEAIPYLEQACTKYREHGGAAELVRAQQWLAEACYAAAQYEQCAKAYRAAIGAAEAVPTAAETAAKLEAGLAAAEEAIARGGYDSPPAY